MRALIYTSPHAEAFLDNERAACSYGVPVLVVRIRRSGLHDEDLGPADILPSGKRALDVVKGFLAGADPGGGRWIRSKAGASLARRFVASCPPLPQKLEDLRVGDSIPRSWLSDEANRALDGEEPQK